MLTRLQSVAFSRAFGGGRNGRNWLIAAASIWLIRRARDVAAPQSEVVYRGVLEPGQTLLVDHTSVDRRGKPTRRRRRR